MIGFIIMALVAFYARLAFHKLTDGVVYAMPLGVAAVFFVTGLLTMTSPMLVPVTLGFYFTDYASWFVRKINKEEDLDKLLQLAASILPEKKSQGNLGPKEQAEADHHERTRKITWGAAAYDGTVSMLKSLYKFTFLTWEAKTIYVIK